ncbi:DUF6519 domain-containing protein [Phaeobacter marinintestinus]|uniref:DUF6519 domain-containing protein n=1 Tax=Falsiphaeobacter marinintestinus TaxID=1492905 RepID=UPI0011B43DC2|nr:DUF6519 domain-containing protein [Phaeobacter marinintestinus]
MSGDYSKDSFEALRDFAGVFLQQGRPVLDSDWNEMVKLLERRIRAGTVDTIGRAVVPLETENGFHIRHGTDGLEIGLGRIYLHGMLVENHGPADFAASGEAGLDAPVFDRGTGDEITDPLGVFDEMVSPLEGYLAYEAQPYWPTPETLPEDGGPYLAYLVGWQREVTPVKDPSLLDPALGGVDSATRWQTVWQVRLLGGIGDGATCATPEEDLIGWDAVMAPSTARLTTNTADVDTPEDPCLVPPTDGYTGLENQFYRVEIHSVGQLGTQEDAWFKYSRENASVAAAIESFGSPANTIIVRTLGRDDLLRFHEGSWVEITDDHREFNHQSGQMLKVTKVNEDTREIELSGTIDADLIPTDAGGDTTRTRHSRLIRWDQHGTIRQQDAAGNWIPWWDLDADNGSAPDGVIPAPPAGTVLLLESGITVEFSTGTGPGRYREMDAWSFWARTAGTQIEPLSNAPPDAVQRHYTPLGIVTFPDVPVDDCRTFWPPEIVPGEGCACSVCITPVSHNSGSLTIQDGIDQVAEQGGGTVCLDPGRYSLSQTITMENLYGVTLKGHGITTVLDYRGATDSAIEITTSIDVRIVDLAILVEPESAGSTAAGPAPAHGLTARHTATLALRRLAIVIGATGDERQDHGIELEGLVLAAKIEECLVAAPFALGSLAAIEGLSKSAAAAEADDLPGWLALGEVRLLDNVFFSGRTAVRLGGLAFGMSPTIIACNLLTGIESGVALDWAEMPTGGTSLDSNSILSSGHAAIVGVNELRVENNTLSGGPTGGDGLLLIPNVVPQAPLSAQVIGNRISDLGGVGLRISANYDRLLIKRNMIRNCALAGIKSEEGYLGRHLSLEDNVINNIPGAPNGAGAAGIAILGVLEGQARGNSISLIGAQMPDGSLNAGIAMQGIVAMAIEGNAIYQIGPDSPEAQAWGVVVRPPLFQLGVTGNRIDGAATQTDEANAWQAIEIGLAEDIEALGEGADLPSSFTGVETSIPGAGAEAMAFAEVDGTLYAISRVDARAVVPSRPVQVSVTGNQVMHFAPSLAPPVAIAVRGTAAVDLSHNQLDLMGGSNLAAQVAVSCNRITASSNSIRHRRDDGLSLLLFAGATTPIGNITSGNIHIAPGGLQPPFDALNILNA